MKFKEYLKNLQELAEEHPEALEFDVVYGIDDEGNAFHDVVFTPTIGYYHGNEFDSNDDVSKKEYNSVCVN